MKKIILIVIGALLVSILGYCSLHDITYMTYNDGNRAGYFIKTSKKGNVFKTHDMPYRDGLRSGYVIKTSKKGVVFKTYEGQMELSGIGITGDIGGSARNIWKFSVDNDAVYQELQKYEYQGEKVILHYTEKENNFPWQGETNYFVDEVRPID